MARYPWLPPVMICLAALLFLQLAACRGLRAGKRSSGAVAEPAAKAGGSETASQALPFESQTAPPADPAPASLTQRWVVSAPEAKQLIDQGATLLDARGQLSLGQLAGAIAVRWDQFSSTQPASRGNLLADDQALSLQLQALGISADKPVVVFGKPPGGWGEDGRLVWMLRTLGHSQAVLVDGGFRALRQAGVSLRPGPGGAPEPGNFVVQRTPTWAIQQEDLRLQLNDPNLVIVDTREAREFTGKTPYGERRGGHIPGAIHLYFKDLLGEEGRLLPRSELLAKLRTLGITPETQVVVYCTGGVRSGWLAAVLVTHGFQVKNYAGSMWEWSAAPEDRYPLVTPDNRAG